MTDVHTRPCVRLTGGGRVTKNFTFDAERLKLIKEVQAFGKAKLIADDHLMWGETTRIAGSRYTIPNVKAVRQGGGPITGRQSGRKKGDCNGLLGDANRALSPTVLIGTTWSGGPVKYAVTRHDLFESGGDELTTAVRLNARQVMRGRDGDGDGGTSVCNAGQELVDGSGGVILLGERKGEDGVAPFVFDDKRVAHAREGLVLEVGEVKVQRFAEERKWSGDEVGAGARGTMAQFGPCTSATGKGPVESRQLNTLLL